MGRWFTGESTHKVDAKGRVSIPAAYRRVLEENDPEWIDGENANLVIVYGNHKMKYLEGYTMAAFGEIADGISRLPRGSRERRLLERYYSGLTLRTQVDDTGRLVLPPRLREKVGIQREAFFIASGDTFQIWSPEVYAIEAEKFDAMFDEFDEDFDPLVLLEGALAQTPGD